MPLWNLRNDESAATLDHRSYDRAEIAGVKGFTDVQQDTPLAL